MEIKCLDEIYMTHNSYFFSLLIEKEIISVKEGEDDETYDIELDIEKNPFISISIMHNIQNNITSITFIDTREYKHALFTPIIVNLPRESYVSIELF